jgi:hypothetical protein
MVAVSASTNRSRGLVLRDWILPKDDPDQERTVTFVADGIRRAWGLGGLRGERKGTRRYGNESRHASGCRAHHSPKSRSPISRRVMTGPAERLVWVPDSDGSSALGCPAVVLESGPRGTNARDRGRRPARGALFVRESD